MLPPAGQIFEKWCFLENVVNFGEKMCLSSRGLAGVLPPAGQIFEKWHLLENFVNLGEIVCVFQDNPNFFVCFVASASAAASFCFCWEVSWDSCYGPLAPLPPL